MRRTVAAQGDERHVLTTGALDSPATDDALAVGKQHDLEQQGRRIGRCACLVVALASIKAREVEFVVDEVVERMLKTTWKKLPFKINRKKARAGVDVLVASHEGYPIRNIH